MNREDLFAVHLTLKSMATEYALEVIAIVIANHNLINSK